MLHQPGVYAVPVEVVETWKDPVGVVGLVGVQTYAARAVSSVVAAAAAAAVAVDVEVAASGMWSGDSISGKPTDLRRSGAKISRTLNVIVQL